MEHKAQEILPEDIWNEEKSKAIMQFILEKRQNELDEFAIGFAVWLSMNCEQSNSKDAWWIYKSNWITTDELLEIYKKEKGL
jgi:hypothetical protein